MGPRELCWPLRLVPVEARKPDLCTHPADQGLDVGWLPRVTVTLGEAAACSRGHVLERLRGELSVANTPDSWSVRALILKGEDGILTGAPISTARATA